MKRIFVVSLVIFALAIPPLVYADVASTGTPPSPAGAPPSPGTIAAPSDETKKSPEEIHNDMQERQDNMRNESSSQMQQRNTGNMQNMRQQSHGNLNQMREQNQGNTEQMQTNAPDAQSKH